MEVKDYRRAAVQQEACPCPLGSPIFRVAGDRLGNVLYNGSRFVRWEDEGAKFEEINCYLDGAHHRLVWNNGLTGVTGFLEVARIQVSYLCEYTHDYYSERICLLCSLFCRGGNRKTRDKYFDLTALRYER